MSNAGPPPPPPAYTPPPAPPFGGTEQLPPKNNGLGIAGFVLSLVGIVPCFWGLQLPALLAVIFSGIGLKQIKASNGAQKGKGMALAGLIIGIVLLAAFALLWGYILFSGDCEFDGGTLSCES